MAGCSTLFKEARSLISPTYQLIAFMGTPYRISSLHVPDAIKIFERITAAFVSSQSFSESSPQEVTSELCREVKNLTEEIFAFMNTVSEGVKAVSYASLSEEPIIRAEYISRYALNALKSYRSYTSSMDYSIPERFQNFSFTISEQAFFRIFTHGKRFERIAPLGENLNCYQKEACCVVSKSSKNLANSSETFFLRICEHPNVMPISAVLENKEEKLEYAMPYLPLGNLTSHTFKTRLELMVFMVSFLEGLNHIHSLKVVHSSLHLNCLFKKEASDAFKSKNVTCVIGGFQAASFSGSAIRPTVSAYSAPEQILSKDFLPTHSSADIWTFGSILFTFLYRKPLFDSSLLKEGSENKFLLAEPNQIAFNAYLNKRIHEEDKTHPLAADHFLRGLMELCFKLNPDERPSASKLLAAFKREVRPF